MKKAVIIKMFRKFTCTMQNDSNDCAAACISTILKQYGVTVSITRIRELAGTDKKGTNLYGIIKAAQAFGFAAKAVQGTRENIRDDFPLPAIAHIITTEGMLHYVVIHKITNKGILLADPAKGIINYRHDDFFNMWTGILILMTPTERLHKNTCKKGVLFHFIYLIKKQKHLFIIISIVSILVSCLGIVSAFFFKILMDTIIPNQLTAQLNIIAVGILILYLFKGLFSFLRQHLLLYLSQKIDLSLILQYYQHVLTLPVNFFDTRKTGEIISRFTDASKLRNAIANAALTIMIDSIMVIAAGIMLYTQSPVLFEISFIIEIIYTVIVFLFKKPIKDINKTIMEQNSQLTSHLVESLKGIETIKAFNAENVINLKTEHKFIKQLKSMFKAGCIENIQYTITNFIGLSGSMLILWAGAYSVIQGNMSIGQLLTFNALLVYFMGPLQNIINLQPMIQSAIVAAERLVEILDIDSEHIVNMKNTSDAESLRGSIEFKNVSFRYGTRRLVLKDLTMSIQPGEKIAIVGESGSGKTTLVKLLLNFYNFEQGDIYINNYHIKDINMIKLREKISYISQDVFLFSGTIIENLSFGLSDCNMDMVIEAAKAAEIHDFINTLPLGYHTVLHENGSDLSGGQKQRFSIARAILKKPDILIMDEATSNLDAVTENAIRKTISELTEGITSIMIAHRLSTIKKCDRIYVMKNGVFAEYGTHRELLKKKGEYYNLWIKQMEGIY